MALRRFLGERSLTSPPTSLAAPGSRIFNIETPPPGGIAPPLPAFRSSRRPSGRACVPAWGLDGGRCGQNGLGVDLVASDSITPRGRPVCP